MSFFCKAVVCFLLALPAVAHSQAFAKITIRPASSADARNMRMQVLPNGDLIANAVPVILFLSYAYDVPVDPSPRFSHLPDWTSNTRERSSVPRSDRRPHSRPSGEDPRTVPETVSVHPVLGPDGSRTLPFLPADCTATDRLDDSSRGHRASARPPGFHRPGCKCHGVTLASSPRPWGSATRQLSAPSRPASPG
jgi:hypothetical protein